MIDGNVTFILFASLMLVCVLITMSFADPIISKGFTIIISDTVALLMFATIMLGLAIVTILVMDHILLAEVMI